METARLQARAMRCAKQLPPVATLSVGAILNGTSVIGSRAKGGTLVIDFRQKR